MKKGFLVISTVVTLGLSALTAHAGFMGTADVSYDSADIKTVYTASKGTLGALEFDIDVTINELGLNDFDSFGYCVEPTQGISGGTYAFTFTSLSELNNDNYYKVAWLVDTYAPRDDVNNDSTEQNQAAALQGLIWETLYGSGYRVVNQNDWISYYYNQYKSALSSLLLSDDLKADLEDNYFIMQNSTKQDLIVQVPHGNEVPEPATLILFGAGLAGLAGIRRGRKNS